MHFVCSSAQGYHKAANLGELRNNHDPCCTYEGDNNVLGQQTSNWFVRQWENGVENPSGTAEFIDRRDSILRYTFEQVRDKNSLASIECKLKFYCTFFWFSSKTIDIVLYKS